MEFPKISIVTPSFNQGKYIEQTILSVLNQNYPNLEYIIMDGGSTDETVAIIKKYESQITYWESEKDKGQTDAINKGFAKCTGDIFNWINSDDYYEPGALLTIGKLFKEKSSAGVVCGKEWSFDTDEPDKKTLNSGSIIKENVFETIRIGIIDQPCTFFRSSKIRDFFPLNVSLKFAMDRQLWWLYLLNYGQQNILQINEVLSNFRLHVESKSISTGHHFEQEYDQLRLSLFNTLDAPEILKRQVSENTIAVEIQWKIKVEPYNYILAAFASFYAERHYVNNNLKTTSMLMKYVKLWKKGSMNQTEKKLWFASNALPHTVIMGFKKIKNTFHLF